MSRAFSSGVWRALASAAVCLLAQPHPAAGQPEAAAPASTSADTLTNTVLTFTNRRGDVFENARVIRVEGGSILFMPADGSLGGGRAKFSDLPDDLQKRVGYDPVKAAQEERARIKPQTNSVDVFLARHIGSKFIASKMLLSSRVFQGDSAELAELTGGRIGRSNVDTSWSILVWPDYFTLVSEQGPSLSSMVKRIGWDFRFDEEVTVRQMFKKFLEWEATAVKNKAEDFDKDIARFAGQVPLGVGERSFTFNWDSSTSYAFLAGSSGEYHSAGTCDVLVFQRLLDSIPKLKEELAEKIRKAEEEKNLFR